MVIHIITRCSRPHNLLQLRDNIFKTSSYENITIKWYIVFDTKTLKDIDAELLQQLDQNNIQLHFQKGNGWGLSQLNNLIHSLDGWIYHLDDDNLLYPNFFKFCYCNIDKTTKALVFSQQVDNKDFTGLKIRQAKPKNIKVGHIDLAQWLIHSDLHKKYKYDSGYTADGKFIEKVYKEQSKYFKIINQVVCYYNYLQSPNKPKVPKVIYIGPDKPLLKTTKVLNYEADNLEVKYIQDDNNINQILQSYKPDAIISVGDSWEQYQNLGNCSIQTRKKWYHVTPDEKTNLGDLAYNLAMNNILKPDYNADSQTISFFTPIHNTGEKLYNTYQSLNQQTYNNWEWVIVNDSSDCGRTLKIAQDIARKDSRVSVYDFREKTGGNIGEVKYRACMLSKGYILAELDHDDLLAPDCAEYLHKAAKKHPECGFFYNDTLEVDQQWNSLTYPDGFAFGYGSYRDQMYNGKSVKVANQHNINPKTIRHIVGVPNHIRAWRRSTYLQLGGHNRGLTIADDYELIVRTFLNTTMCKIPRLGYIQFIYDNQVGTNTHNLSRADIQRRVRTIAAKYNQQIKGRFEQLGLKDWAYQGNPDYPILTPSKFGKHEQRANVIYKQ